MIQTSIETINDRPVTIVRKPFDAEWVREQLAMGIPVLAECDAGVVILTHIKGPNRDRFSGVYQDDPSLPSLHHEKKKQTP